MRSASGGLFLSQVYYWWQSKDGKWNYKFNQEFIQEIGLSEWELRKAKEKAIELGIIEFKLGRVGKLANVPFYKINEEILFELLKSFANQDEKVNHNVKNSDLSIAIEDSTPPLEDSSIGHEYYTRGLENNAIGLESVSQPLYTENTTKNTQEITPNITPYPLKGETLSDDYSQTKGNRKKSIKAKSYSLPQVNESDLTDAENNAINYWLTYKQEKKQEYKPTGLKMLINTIKGHKNQGCNIQAAIEISISNNWQGIIYEKGYQQFGRYTNPTPQQQSKEILKNCNDGWEQFNEDFLKTNVNNLPFVKGAINNEKK
jgi:hypothetical protein